MIGLSKKLPPVSSISVSKIAVGMSAELITRRLFFVRFLPSSLKIGGGTKEREGKNLLCRSVFSSLLLLRLVSLKLMFRRRKFVKRGEGGEKLDESSSSSPPQLLFFPRGGGGRGEVETGVVEFFLRPPPPFGSSLFSFGPLASRSFVRFVAAVSVEAADDVQASLAREIKRGEGGAARQETGRRGNRGEGEKKV